MGNLRDEVYENLDYLSKLTEVVISPQNEALAKLPDRIPLSYNDIQRFKYYSWGRAYSLDAHSILRESLKGDIVDPEIISQIRENFVFEISPDFEIDFVNGTMTGQIAVVKQTTQIEEKRLLEMAVDNAVRHLSRYEWPTRRIKERTITILNLLEPGTGMAWAKQLEGRVGYAARGAITEKLRDVILENKWRVRDANVIVKMGEWIHSYMSEEGDLGIGLVNLMKLKIMIDKDLPVYSIDEVKSVDPR